MEKVNLQTTDMVDENIKRIGKLFPNCLTEVKDENGRPQVAIDFDQLRQELSKDIVEGPVERYQFTWPDKRNAIRLANAPTTDTLRPVRNDETTPTGADSEGNPYCSTGSVNFDTTENLYIEGDNLQVLKLLREDYLGKIKMIYIDPPYNTGKDFVYDDDFSQSSDEYIHNSGQTDENGNRLVANTESNGRFHTDWLNMIYPRLKVAKDLLSEDGVIFISIDDNEQKNLKNICDEVFGESNFIACFIWRQGKKSSGNLVGVNHEYAIAYAKNKRIIDKPELQWKKRKDGLDKIYNEYSKLKKQYGSDTKKIQEEIRIFFSNLAENDPAYSSKHYNYVDSKGLFFADNSCAPDRPETRCHKPLIHPITGKQTAVPSLGWRWNEATLDKLVAEDKIFYGETEATVPKIKKYLTEMEYELPVSVIYKDGRGASKRLSDLFGKKVFDFPKDEEIIKNFILCCGTKEQDVVLDFFSGSATTAHAVMQLNAEDGGERKFIMVQLPEVTDVKSEAHKAGYKNICEIGKERIRRAGKKIKEEHPEAKDLDIGFRVLKLDTSNMEDVQRTPKQYTQASLFADNLKTGRTEEDLLFQTMLRLGIDLSAKIESFNSHGKTVFNVNDNYLLACFDTDVNESAIEEIAKRQPVYFVMRDASLASDNVRDNIDQLWKHYNPGREKDLIII